MAPGPAGPGRSVGGAEYPTAPPEQWPSGPPGAPIPSWCGPPPGGPGGPSSPPGRGDDRTVPVVVTAIAVVCVLALLILGIGALASSDGGEEATDTTIDLSDPEITAPPSEEPVDPTMPTVPGFPGSGVDPADQARPLAEVVPELIDFVEVTRGQEFETEPDVEAATAEDFEAQLAADQAEQVPEAEAAAVGAVALGLLPEDFDVAAGAGDLGASFVFGFYDPDTAKLLVKGDVVTPFVQSVIVHELTHALDDQVFGLARLDELAERPDESAFGFLSLVEGTASYVQNAFVDQLSADDKAAYDAEQVTLGFDQMPSAFSLPPYLLIESQVPYVTGEAFVAALIDEGGTAEVDTAYGTPPTTSEQIMDPTRFFAGEGAVALSPLAAPDGVEPADQGAFGAADLRLLGIASDPMAIVDPNAPLLQPVPGFGGGQFVSWTEGDQACISLEAVGDDADGSRTIEGLLGAWAANVPEAEVSARIGGNGLAVVTATSCV